MRFPVSGSLKGAIFTDAGNERLTRNDPDRPDAQLRTDRYLQEIAVGSGAGLRLDIQFFVLRLDAAFPLRDPIRGWVVDEVNFSNRDWRRNNIVYNLAIGYPF
jgi:outer membrane protein insertion porin family